MLQFRHYVPQSHSNCNIPLQLSAMWSVFIAQLQLYIAITIICNLLVYVHSAICTDTCNFCVIAYHGCNWGTLQHSLNTYPQRSVQGWVRLAEGFRHGRLRLILLGPLVVLAVSPSGYGSHHTVPRVCRQTGVVQLMHSVGAVAGQRQACAAVVLTTECEGLPFRDVSGNQRQDRDNSALYSVPALHRDSPANRCLREALYDFVYAHSMQLPCPLLRHDVIAVR